jgi:hypothetical protein
MLENNVHLQIMNTTLTNMQQRNTKTGYLMMAKSAIFPFESMPEVAAVLQTLAEIYNQLERPSVDNLRQQLLALRTANPNTMYVELAQPRKVLHVGRGVNPSVTQGRAPIPDFIDMIDFALAELQKGWPQQEVVAQPNEVQEGKRNRKTCDCSLDSIAKTIKSFIWASPQPQGEQNNNEHTSTGPRPGKSKTK